MKSLFNIIQIYLENPSDKDMERVLERESTKNNTIKMYKKINDLERQLKGERRIKIEAADRLRDINSFIPSCYAGVSQELIKIINQLKGERNETTHKNI